MQLEFMLFADIAPVASAVTAEITIEIWLNAVLKCYTRTSYRREIHAR